MYAVIGIALLLSACAPSKNAWKALNAPHKYYVVQPYTRCMWESEAPNAAAFHSREDCGK